MQRLGWVLLVYGALLWVIGMWLFIANARAAQPQRPIPAEQFDKRTHTWLARAMVAESGWLAQNDQIAVAYVFARRWKAMHKRWPHLRFVDVIFSYSAGIGASRREYTKRQTWIRSLSPTMAKPVGWPRAASWRRHRPLWSRAMDRADLWARGMVADPCRGKAEYFGGGMDKPTKRMIVVKCKGVRNIFYRVEGK